ncbi:MAG: carbohydrate binding family 9 domain-containing protein [Melioribacter sp.]|nr:carbohydrate binding family 9 domain-containing protein [Melioribacter sp.]
MINKDFYFYLLVVVLLVLAGSSYAQNRETLKPIFATIPPIIDGQLDDAVWKSAPKVSEFKTFTPDFGKDLSEKTIVYMAYDKEYIYFAYKCYDSQPDKIRANVTSRDNIRSEDWICINLDSFNDQQSLYALYVNPLGIQEDSRFTGNTEDTSIDLIWYSAGKIDPDGYSIEIKLPLKSLRYSNTNPVQMSVFFERRISRTSEQGSFPAMDPAKGYAFLTQMQPIFYYDVEHYALIELLPAITYGQKHTNVKGKLETEEVNRDLSLTLKYGLTSDLILDATYNPDFSQVEADAGQVDVNLRYNIFYPEKRQFFLEGKENFGLAATSINEVDPVYSIIHTRNIISPIAGIKLVGKVNESNTIAAIYSIDEQTDIYTGKERDYHFPIIRYKRNLSDDGFIGATIASKEHADNFSRIAGVDGQIRLTQASSLEFNGILSQSKLTSASDKNFGNTFGLRYISGSRDIDMDYAIKNVSEDFRADMGFIRRTGVTAFSGSIKPKFYPGVESIQRINAELFSAQTKDNIYNKWETSNYVAATMFFLGSLNVRVKYSYSTEIYLNQKFNTGGLTTSFGGLVSNTLNFAVIYKKINSIYYSNSPFQGSSNVVQAIAIFQPSDNITTRFDFIFSDFKRDSDNKILYEYPITRVRLTYQMNKYLFFRGIAEYNKYRRQLLTDFLASFTYIPGTVLHFGYGSIYQKTEWVNNNYIPADNFLEMKRGFFFKASYLWRL